MIQLTETLYLDSSPHYHKYGWITKVDGQFNVNHDEIKEGVRLCRERGYYVGDIGQELSPLGKAMMKLTE
jgi:hypothetical protein